MATRFTADIGSDSLDRTCDLCTDRVLHAISYCEACKLALCKGCDKKHRTGKQTRDHELLTGDQLLALFVGNQIPEVMMCEKHKTKIEYFCKTDNVVCCAKCKRLSHKNCDIVDINMHTSQSNMANSINEVEQKLNNLENWYENMRTKNLKNKAALKLQVRKCRDKVKNIRKEFTDILNEIEIRMEENIRHLEDKYTEKLEDYLSVTDENLNKIRDSMESMKKYNDSGQNDVMFVSMKKVEGEIPEFSRIIEKLVKEHQDFNIQFTQNSLVTKCLNELNSFGHVDNIELCKSDLSAQNIVAGDLRRHDVGCEKGQSIVTMPDGHVVLACAQYGLKLLDESFREQFTLPIRAITACRISDTDVLVSMGKDKQLQIVKVLPRMVVKRSIIMKRECTGVDFNNGDIYVTCHNNPGDGEVRVLAKNGEFKRRLGYIDGKYIFTCPVGIKVSSTGDRVFVIDNNDNTVTCLDKVGRAKYKLCDTDLIAPFGLCLDPYDNLLILVTGNGLVNLVVITPQSKKHGVNLSTINTIGYPICVAYSDIGGGLMLGCRSADGRSLVTGNFITQ